MAPSFLQSSFATKPPATSEALSFQVGARAIAVLLMMAAFALAAGAADRVTVQGLQQAVSAAHSLPDKDAARRLGELELTERLTTARLTQLQADLPGEQARLALLALADASAFLDLPAADIVQLPAPDSATQGRLVSLAADFVVATLPRMPDFSATRTTIRFKDLKVSRVYQQPVIVPNQPLFFTDRTSATVLYRDGREVVEAPGAKKGDAHPELQGGLTNWGVFGPLLGVVLADVLKGKMGWGHWEQGAAGPVAVFRYAVAAEKSNYSVNYCCFIAGEGVIRDLKVTPAYHGEIGIDPHSGAVLRLVVKSDLKPGLQVLRADVLVEYSPIELGATTYICPAKSVSLTRATEVVAKGVISMGDKTFYDEIAGRPQVTSINDVVFGNYHQFRGEMRILPADSEEPDGGAPAAPQATTQTPPKE